MTARPRLFRVCEQKTSILARDRDEAVRKAAKMLFGKHRIGFVVPEPPGGRGRGRFCAYTTAYGRDPLRPHHDRLGCFQIFEVRPR